MFNSCLPPCLTTNINMEVIFSLVLYIVIFNNQTIHQGSMYHFTFFNSISSLDFCGGFFPKWLVDSLPPHSPIFQ